jgi:hypothetical protein
VDLKVRPIHHRTADRVRAHILLCMLAYYVVVDDNYLGRMTTSILSG